MAAKYAAGVHANSGWYQQDHVLEHLAASGSVDAMMGANEG